MGKKRSMDPGLKYLMDMHFNRIRGKYGLENRLKQVFGEKKGQEILDQYKVLQGTEQFYNFKNSDPRISRCFSEVFDGDIIRKACNYIAEHKEFFGSTILEVGCDCGIISCFLAKTFPEAKIVSIDRCAAAIEIAKQAAKEQGLENIVFLVCDLKDFNEAFDTVFSMRTVQQNFKAEEDPVNDLGEQAEIFKESLNRYASAISRAVSDHGNLISIDRISRNALLLGWMEAMGAAGLTFNPSSYEELICEEDGDESVISASIFYKGMEKEIEAIEMFYIACSKYLNYDQAQYGGWDAKIVFECKRGELIEGYKLEYPKLHIKERISLWTHIADETGLVVYYNKDGFANTSFYDISQKDEILKFIREHINKTRAGGNVVITKIKKPRK